MADETNATTTTSAEATGTTETPAGNAGAQAAQQQESRPGTDLERLIQSAVDRATNKIGNDNKKLREENERLKKEKLSDDEIKQLEMQEQKKALDERDRALTEKENRWIAMQAIKEIGLDDGSKDSLAIVDFVMAEDEAGIRERVKTFDALVKRIVSGRVDAEFKRNGRTPGVGTDGSGGGGNETVSYAAKLGKSAAAANKASQSIIDQYIGGK